MVFVKGRSEKREGGTFRSSEVSYPDEKMRVQNQKSFLIISCVETRDWQPFLTHGGIIDNR